MRRDRQPERRCADIVILNGGTLKKIERDELEEDAFKARIIQSLKEEEYA